MGMTIKKIVLTALALVLMMPGPAPAQQKKLKVVTTLNYLRYLAEQVGGTLF